MNILIVQIQTFSGLNIHFFLLILKEMNVCSWTPKRMGAQALYLVTSACEAHPEAGRGEPRLQLPRPLGPLGSTRPICGDQHLPLIAWKEGRCKSGSVSCILFFGSGNCAIKTSLMISERHGYK